ncbi:conserved hypothetical protein [Rippkaea orientalis PCC 8801]|uniref:Periplasmic protein n=1 Tax=Rippkaea orientalis (strain PCC 8801 / RF-1) TaxID=41431 RepID=B7K009_RIPO1|nr:DUF2092 domain-containing protein [Rippkaea orientalis]ACK66156.1 conserved hypothetical protein [Rippkaea orientalis PCC 8801]
MKRLFSLRILPILLLNYGIFCGLSPGIFAQQLDTPDASSSPQLKTTEELLKKACSFLRDQKSFTVEVDITYDDVIDSGEKVQYSAYQKVWVKKPNQLRSDYVGDERNTNFYYDGKSFTLFTPDLNLYGTKMAPLNIDESIEDLEQNYGITIPLSNLFVSDPCVALDSDIQKSLFVGTNLVNRVETYHILLTREDRDVQLWISKDEQPVLLKAIITYKNLPSSPQYTAVFSQWNFNPSIEKDTFTFTVPDDAAEIEFLPTKDVMNNSEQ